ncbi:MAG: hypothetical protein A2201_00480 [Alicyclobacillus sp. RIFOXYA1_FULL_53_8]|nr:MAG: hypothetical protein A2201_00480 [Alicyclobacillus sp. RIFOXYA1_FULL_53_8]
MATEAEIGYRDALHQLQRHLHKRVKTLQTELKEADEAEHNQIRARISEVEHMLEVLESLRR